MKITIINCNNIDRGDIQIEANKLNIKYAMNGTGKSTIARAIEIHVHGNGSISELKPFKYLDSGGAENMPSVSGIEDIKSVLVFNDNYINQYAFLQDEIIANSFEIFIKTRDYDAHFECIEKIISAIKETFNKSSEIDQVISDLGVLSDSFGKAKSGISEAGMLAKGIGKGNKVAHIPKGLESYADYLKSSTNVKWLKWQIEGNNYSSLSSKCPYCTSSTESLKEIIARIGKEYDAKSIEHLNRIISIFESLGKYFSVETNNRIQQLAVNPTGLSEEQKTYLVHLKDQINTLKEKMLNLKGLTYFSMKDVDKVSDYLTNIKIDLSYLPQLNSENTQTIVNDINNSLDSVLSQVGVLQGEVNKQKCLIKETIENNKGEINEFLKNAGYKYLVDVEYVGGKYKMRLRHVDCNQAVTKGSQHLSYGERNAFSLILFMYECISKNPDLIVLDDPISSFDRNKKYAVIDMLFRSNNSLREKTVLMMTHDLEPIIDILYTLPHNFCPLPSAAFLEIKNSVLKEIEIQRTDILTFGQICELNISASSEDVVKLVYLRRYFEILDNKGLPYQLLANLFKKRKTQVNRELDKETPFSPAALSDATSTIAKKIPDFNYNQLLLKFSDYEGMKAIYTKLTCNYEKLQIFRIMQESRNVSESRVINKFINETFHIENEFIMQINPCKYDIVPEYIIDECNGLINLTSEGVAHMGNSPDK